MLSLLTALHELAARRGEGLRPDLLALLKRTAPQTEDGQPETCSGTDQAAPDTAEPKSPRWADHLRF